LHRDYSVFASVDENGRIEGPWRVEHERERAELRKFLRRFPSGTPVAVETTGSWYWMIDELEAAGLQPMLANSYEARQRMRGPHKTDPLDARGLATLLRNGTLPSVWIPAAKLRDLRALMRTRLALVAQRTTIKNRIVAAVNRYGLRDDSCGDLFIGKGRLRLNVYIAGMPAQTREAALEEWVVVDELREHIENLEQRIAQHIGRIGYVRLLKTMPGVGEILGATIWLEVGDVERFPSAAHLASYAGLVPTVHASGGKVHLGPTTRQSNHYLRWAFVEAACSIVALQHRHGPIHTVLLYQRLKQHKCHGKAAVAVARHLAESTWWILKQKQPYREPVPLAVSSSTHGQARRPF
jgi:transposase